MAYGWRRRASTDTAAIQGQTAVDEVARDRVRAELSLLLPKPGELQAAAEDHAKFVVTGTASAYLRCAMKFKSLPAGFVIPAQPIKGSKPPSGADWVHEIKHDGYRLIVHRDGPVVRLYSRNALDWTTRLPAIAAAARRIKAKSFTIDWRGCCTRA